MSWFRRKTRSATTVEISPDEILIDASNLPHFDAGRLEGRIDRPISGRALVILWSLVALAMVVFLGRSIELMAVHGARYAQLSENNRLEYAPVIAERGIIYDRNGVELAWNVPHTVGGVAEAFAERAYITATGSAHVLGYVRLPARDAKGLLYSTSTEGVSGAELAFDDVLRGVNGKRIVETDARLSVVSSGVLVPPVPGKAVTLSIDSRLQSGLHEAIRNLAERIPFAGGAGVIMDVHTGEILAMTSYPEYSANALVSRDADRVQAYANDARTPYLNRVLSGQYTPGSIVKPYVAAAALAEGIVRPETTFVSTGALYVPNPYNPGRFSTFTDWKAHGTVDVRRALAVSSNVYFYYVGGGFGGQNGLGISRIVQYAKYFGFGESTGIEIGGEVVGVVPSPEWKAKVFDDPDWRLGDTYNSAIGQYGWQTTPLQAVRAVAAIANGGTLVTPTIQLGKTSVNRRIPIRDDVLRTVREGMRQGALYGTASGLNVPYVELAGKTGTAELGSNKAFVHSWVTGFWPYEEPRYAFVIMMERGPRSNLYGATGAARAFFDWAHSEDLPYLEP